jgi:hypothetical protein
MHNNHPFFTHIDVTTQTSADATEGASHVNTQVLGLLHQLVVAQNRQNELLEELVKQSTAAQRQRAAELGQWKQSHPELARQCRTAAETLGHAQTEFLRSITAEVADNGESFSDGEFMLNEFVDRFGPRLAHLNGVLQVLTQLGNAPTLQG